MPLTNFKRQEKDMRGEKEFTFFAYKTAGGDFKKLKAAKKDFSKTADGNLHFLVQRQRFFSQTIFSANTLKDATFKSSYVDKDNFFSKKLTTTASVDLTNGSEVPFSFYIGPNERKLLKTIDKDLVNILPKGVLGLPLVKWISGLFNWMRPLSGNMGLLILLMTVIIKLALSPLTYKSYLSQAKMQMLKPESVAYPLYCKYQYSSLYITSLEHPFSLDKSLFYGQKIFQHLILSFSYHLKFQY